jgi:hypothetical protein
MSWLLPVLIWIAVAVVVMTGFVVAVRRTDDLATPRLQIGVRHLPTSANDLPPTFKLRLLGAAVTFLVLAVVIAPSGYAQVPVLQLPPLHVEAPSPSCVDVQVEGARSISFDCLNAKLKAEAQQQSDAAPTVTAKDIAGNGAPTTVGTFSYTGTSIRMGNTFGKSAFPQRPPATSFTNALVPTGAR